MNYEILNELIDRYESNLDLLYNEEHDELFKWKAIKTFRAEWFRPEGDFSSFADRFTAAKRDFSLLIDNSQMHPSTGVLKLWEKEPETVERLFREVLFADPNGSVPAVQENMDRFIAGYEELRQKYYPANWSYKQERHSASVFLAAFDPEFNFIFKSGEATTMAKYIDFPYAIGAGTKFNLSNYYRLCEVIVEELKKHESLLQKHFGMLKEEHYNDKSLHLLAFDLMYCCHFYGFYKGLPIPVAGKKGKLFAPPAFTPEELARLQEKRLARIKEIQEKIEELERECDECRELSLLGVQVITEKYGIGTVVAQEMNLVKVRFAEGEKSFVLHQKFSARPHFENDEFVISQFTAYADRQEQIQKLKKELETI